MPKIFGRSLDEHRDNTRRALFDALNVLMAEKGFKNVSMSALAQRAGIRRTTIYNHFTDKEDILLAFVESEMGEYLARTREMLEQATTSLDKIRLYVRSQLLAERTYLMAPGPPLKDVISPDTGVKMAEHIRQTTALLHSILQEAVADATIPDQDFKTTTQLINGTLTGRRVPREEPMRTEFFLATERFVVQGLGAVMPENPREFPVPPVSS